MTLQSVLLLLALALVATGAAASSATSSLHHEFEAWKVRYNKSYATAEEHVRRFGIYKSTSELVERHNAEAARGLHRFTLAKNKFADLTHEEFRASYLGGFAKRPSSKASPVVATTIPATGTTLPASWDWRTQGGVNPIKNQGGCGCCWAFSATSAMETAWFVKTGNLLSLSEQMCLDCANNGQDQCFGRHKGGLPWDCYQQVIQQQGDNLESVYRYLGDQSGSCQYDSTQAVATGFTNYTTFPSGNETALAYAAVQSAVSIAIDANSTLFQLYGGGIYENPTCGNDMQHLDHAVVVIGFGVLNGGNYWLVRNSWGTHWGLDGYILMAKDQNNACGIATVPTVPVV